MSKNLKLILVFIASAVLCTIGDYFHVREGVASYPSNTLPTILGVPFWVPIQFGIAGILGVLLTPLEKKLVKVRSVPAHVGLLPISTCVLFFMMAYLFSSFYFSNVVIKVALIFMMGVIPWLLHDGTNLGFLSIILVAFGGVAYEAMLGALNIFTYTPSPENLFLNIPIWLFGIYAAAATSIRVIAYTILDI